MPAEVEEAKFLSEELQTLYQSAKGLLESYVNVERLRRVLEESDVPAALTHFTDVYLQGWHLALRLVPSQSASGAASHHLSGTTVCSAELPQLTLPTFHGHLPAWPEFYSQNVLL